MEPRISLVTCAVEDLGRSRDFCEVDAVLATARSAGASHVSLAVERRWGGYSGYFADPDGYRWEIAWAPGAIEALVLPGL